MQSARDFSRFCKKKETLPAVLAREPDELPRSAEKKETIAHLQPCPRLGR